MYRITNTHKMKKIEKLSDSDLRELIIMAERMLDQMAIFSHVSEHFNPSIKKQLETYFAQLLQEETNREDWGAIVDKQIAK